MKVLGMVLLACGVGSAVADDLTEGKRVFDRHCSECHAAGFGHPGTQELAWTRGPSKSVLENRTDLVPAYVALVVRHGLNEMPPFRPTEIDDWALQSLVQYLTANKAKPKPR